MLATRAWTSRLPSPPGSRGRARGRGMRVVGDRSSAFAPTSGAPPRPRDVDRAKRRGADAVSVATPPDAMARRRAALVSERRSADEDDGLSPPADAHSPANDSRPPPASSLFPSLARARVAPVRLLACYDDVVACICEEMDRTAAGDRVEFSVYVLEPGESTERVLRSMRRAARRGVRVDCSLDCSVISQFTRWCEGTETWADRLTALAAEFPGVVTFAPRRVPTHAKYVMCHRVGSTSTAVFGGVNIGDRFRDWRDFAIRAEGADAVGALAVSVNGAVDERTHLSEWEKRDGGAPVSVSVSTLVGRVQTSASRLQSRASRLSRKVRSTIASRTVGSRYRDARSDAAARAAGVGFVSNRPSGFDVVAWAAPWWRTFPGRFDVLPALEALMADERYDSYRVAAAYVDGAGVNVLEAALRRGADVTLVMPRTPNVYGEANKKALRRLVDEDAKRAEGGGSRGRLRAYVCDDMLHAKVFLATSSRRLAPDAAMVGSCNLKRRSFGQFAELNALITQARCTKQLGEEMEKLVRDSEEVTSGSEALVFEEPRATVEEWLG